VRPLRLARVSPADVGANFAPDRGKRAVDVQKTTMPRTALQGNQDGPSFARLILLRLQLRTDETRRLMRHSGISYCEIHGRIRNAAGTMDNNYSISQNGSHLTYVQFSFFVDPQAKRRVSCIGFISLDALEDDRDQDSSKLVNVSPFQSFKVRLPRSIIRELIDSSQSILKKSSKRYHKIDRHWRFSGTRSIRRQRVAEFSGHPKGILIKFPS